MLCGTCSLTAKIENYKAPKRAALIPNHRHLIFCPIIASTGHVHGFWAVLQHCSGYWPSWQSLGAMFPFNISLFAALRKLYACVVQRNQRGGGKLLPWRSGRKKRERSWEAFLSSVTYNEGNNLTFTFRSAVKFKAQLITVHMTTNWAVWYHIEYTFNSNWIYILSAIVCRAKLHRTGRFCLPGRSFGFVTHFYFSTLIQNVNIYLNSLYIIICYIIQMPFFLLLFSWDRLLFVKAAAIFHS